jgi:hypothetical protein
MKKDIRTVNSISRKYKMTPKQRQRFHDRIHELKDRGHFGSAGGGDFTFEELEEIAREIVGLANNG